MNQCPNCGYVLPSPRAPIGEGTRAAERKKKLNQNELAIGKILCESEQPLTVKQVQGILYEKGIKRQRRREKTPSGGWNYQQVQVTLSMLLGTKAKTISMTKSREYVDEDQYRHANPIPHYYMTPEQKERFKEIQFRQGQISLSTIRLHRKCPRCGAII